MGLSLHSGPVNQDSGIGVESGKGETHVVVEKTDLAGGYSGVLELDGGSLFAAEYYNVASFDSDGTGSCGVRARGLVEFLIFFLFLRGLGPVVGWWMDGWVGWDGNAGGG